MSGSAAARHRRALHWVDTMLGNVKNAIHGTYHAINAMVGRRNWLFADTVGGANASANLYSLIETAKANAIDPYKYLCALFTALPKATRLEDYEALLPWRIKLASG